MVETKPLKSWSDFLEEVRSLAKDYAERQRPPLFRGHSDCKWNLKTTLERHYESEARSFNQSFIEYYKRASLSPKSAIESLIGRRWDNFPDYWRVANKLETESDSSLEQILNDWPEIYEFFIYLRHHGYPSPLLDWTASPYVAAFFAFDTVNRGAAPVSVAVYTFVPDSSGGFFRSGRKLILVGPYGRSHARHLLQQSRYTWCVERRGIHDYLIQSHDEVINEAAEGDGAKGDGKVLKLTIPATERLVALKELDLMNINAFSLYGSEDALVSTVARRELLFKK